jgi:hypothetical protein
MKLITILLIALNPLHKEKSIRYEHHKDLSGLKCVGSIGGGL